MNLGNIRHVWCAEGYTIPTGGEEKNLGVTTFVLLPSAEMCRVRFLRRARAHACRRGGSGLSLVNGCTWACIRVSLEDICHFGVAVSTYTAEHWRKLFEDLVHAVP
jgi:hypothetical protein